MCSVKFCYSKILQKIKYCINTAHQISQCLIPNNLWNHFKKLTPNVCTQSYLCSHGSELCNKISGVSYLEYITRRTNCKFQACTYSEYHKWYFLPSQRLLHYSYSPPRRRYTANFIEFAIAILEICTTQFTLPFFLMYSSVVALIFQKGTFKIMIIHQCTLK